ncbi:class I SAM-dependent methyltransferase [Lampropedia aestuarii]|uniref:Class I SAM-dependent methyltransferase n=1 Tax=Lampropedia aestuarii TaxID=2562762 RepID=A0A4S5BPM7_9BURK|nr:class I SAM-dependent methyltransferase [Lampropedia aestuarii]MDH5856302.1 class I SAM-dependent methyltransferase [Lampropedia aestuarii]THJ34259.1 class I SAM-dependent methyltransferase [Lampropedia aestuarii]
MQVTHEFVREGRAGKTRCDSQPVLDLLAQVERYWDIRAESYSQSNQNELKGDKADVWQALLLQHCPTGRQLRVLDVGAGPGFFSILLARAGHQVTAIDVTAAMLHEARTNAGALVDAIHFIEGDVENLPFADASFDLVVTRNVTWNLKHPAQAYADWHRVLAPGGHLVNFDANWYLHLFDADLGAQFEADRQYTAANGIEDHYVSTDTKTMTEIALQLPLSQTLRPQWDQHTLAQVGFAKVEIDASIGEQVWSAEEKANYRSTPMFMIVAHKQAAAGGLA